MSVNITAKRWHGAPLDPSPPPRVYVSGQAEEVALAPPVEPGNATEVDDDGSEDDPVVKDVSRHTTEATTIEDPTQEPTTTPNKQQHHQRGRGWGRGIKRDFHETLGVSMMDLLCQQQANQADLTLSSSRLLFSCDVINNRHGGVRR